MFRALLLLLGVSFIPFLKGKMTLHFHPMKLQVQLSPQEQWTTPAPSKEILEILTQPFHFLGNGSQTYVFESEDGKTVLKLFRYNRSRFPWIHSLKGLLHKKKKADLFTKLDKTFQAYLLALRHVPDRTGLLYLHFNPGESLPTLPIRDPIGRTWQLPLTHCRFVLQKKAQPFKEALLAAIEKGEGTEELIASFLELLKERSAKGIRNSDPNLWPNFGVIDGKVVEIDCGNYRWRPELLKDQREEIHRFSEQLRAWLVEHAKTI